MIVTFIVMSTLGSDEPAIRIEHVAELCLRIPCKRRHMLSKFLSQGLIVLTSGKTVIERFHLSRHLRDIPHTLKTSVSVIPHKRLWIFKHTGFFIHKIEDRKVHHLLTAHSLSKIIKKCWSIRKFGSCISEVHHPAILYK